MNGEFATTLAALQQRFKGRAAGDLDVLLAFREGQAADVATLRFTVHRLAGAAATFGYPSVSAAATKVETGLLSQGAVDPSDLAVLIEELRKVAIWQ
jgi:HPt (histidine-containing phosphotransfer) domain-containing protein